MFALVRKEGYFMEHYGFYTGHCYIHQGELFVVCDYEPKKAKAYTTRARAENAAKTLSLKSGDAWEVVSLA